MCSERSSLSRTGASPHAKSHYLQFNTLISSEPMRRSIFVAAFHHLGWTIREDVSKWRAQSVFQRPLSFCFWNGPTETTDLFIWARGGRGRGKRRGRQTDRQLGRDWPLRSWGSFTFMSPPLHSGKTGGRAPNLWKPLQWCTNESNADREWQLSPFIMILHHGKKKREKKKLTHVAAQSCGASTRPTVRFEPPDKTN